MKNLLKGLKLSDKIFEKHNFELVKLSDYQGWSYQKRTFKSGLILTFEEHTGFLLHSDVDEAELNIFSEHELINIIRVLEYKKETFLEKKKKNIFKKLKVLLRIENGNIIF